MTCFCEKAFQSNYLDTSPDMNKHTHRKFTVSACRLNVLFDTCVGGHITVIDYIIPQWWVQIHRARVARAVIPRCR